MPLCSIVPRMRVKREMDRARKMRPAGRRSFMASNLSRPDGVLVQRRKTMNATTAAASTNTK